MSSTVDSHIRTAGRLIKPALETGICAGFTEVLSGLLSHYPHFTAARSIDRFRRRRGMNVDGDGRLAPYIVA
jgi:hypothetical protein